MPRKSIAAAALFFLAVAGCQHDANDAHVIKSTDTNAPILPLVTGRTIKDSPVRRPTGS